MEGSGGQSEFVAPPVPSEPPLLGQPPAPDRPGLLRRVAWWVVGPLLTTGLLAVSLGMILGSPTTVRSPTPADPAAIGLLLVLAATLLFRRRWPVESTLVASSAVAVLAVRQYPLTLMAFAPSLCVAAAVYRCEVRRALVAIVAAAIGLGTASAVGGYRTSDLAVVLQVAVVSVVVAVVARLVRLGIANRRERGADPVDQDAPRWYLGQPRPVAGWPDSQAGWATAAVGALVVVVAVSVLMHDLTTVPPLAEPGERVVIDEPGQAAVTGAAATGDGSVYAVGGLGGHLAADSGLRVRRYGPANDLRWERSVDAPLWIMPGETPGLAVAPLGDGGSSALIAVTWMEDVSTGVGDQEPTADAAVIEVLDDSGERRWSDRFGEAGTVFLLAAPVGLPDGGFAVAGGVNEPLEEPLRGPSDGFVRSYRADGTVRWTRQFGADDTDGAVALASDGAGVLYVVGGAYGELEPGGTGAFVAKLDEAGAVEWIRQFGVTQRDVAVSVAVHDEGPVVVWGVSTFGSGPQRRHVTSFDPDGNVRWEYDHDATGSGIDKVTVVDGRVMASGCQPRSFLGMPVGLEVGIVVEIAGGRADSVRELGGLSSTCIQALAPGPGASLLVGGATEDEESVAGRPFLVALEPE